MGAKNVMGAKKPPKLDKIVIISVRELCDSKNIKVNISPKFFNVFTEFQKQMFHKGPRPNTSAFVFELKPEFPNIPTGVPKIKFGLKYNL